MRSNRRSDSSINANISSGMDSTPRPDARTVVHDDASCMRDGQPRPEYTWGDRNSCEQRTPCQSQPLDYVQRAVSDTLTARQIFDVPKKSLIP